MRKRDLAGTCECGHIDYLSHEQSTCGVRDWVYWYALLAVGAVRDAVAWVRDDPAQAFDAETGATRCVRRRSGVDYIGPERYGKSSRESR